MALKSDEKELLDIVLGEIGDDEKRIEWGITKALQNINDKARRIYLRNLLRREAKRILRAAHEKFPSRK